MIWIFRFFDFLSIVLPVKLVYFVSGFIGILVYCLGLYKKGRKRAVKNLRQAGISSWGLSSFIGFARYLGEFMTAFRLNRENLNQWMELVRIDRLEAEYNKGKGVIGLTGHLGDWEVGAAMLPLKGYPASVVSIHYMNKAVAGFYEQRRKKKGLKVIYIEEIKKMVRVLKEGQILAILGDRVYSGKGVEVKFFGKIAKFPLGAFWLALKTQASIIPIFAVHEKGKLKVYFEKPIFVKNKEDVMKGLYQYIGILERYIRRYPNEWCAYDVIWEI